MEQHKYVLVIVAISQAGTTTHHTDDLCIVCSSCTDFDRMNKLTLSNIIAGRNFLTTFRFCLDYIFICFSCFPKTHCDISFPCYDRVAIFLEKMQAFNKMHTWKTILLPIASSHRNTKLLLLFTQVDSLRPDDFRTVIP